MSKKTNISVVIPTFDRASVVCRAIDSALAQTLPAFEIIVVNDGSTDNSSQIIEENYRDKLTLLEQCNLGVSAARNTGISKASGDWIALLDSDDEWMPTKLEQQAALIESNPGCVLCHCDEKWVRNGVRVNQMNKHKKHGGEIYQQCLPLCAISPSAVVIKKTLLDSIGLFDESLPACEDYDLWLRICSQHEVHYLDQPLLVKYGGHNDQLSRKHWGMDRFRIRALQKILDSNKLDSEKRIPTESMLNRKTKILLNGARKHNNVSLINECQQVFKKYGFPPPIDTDVEPETALR